MHILIIHEYILSHRQSPFIQVRRPHCCIPCSVLKSTISALEQIKNEGTWCPVTGWHDMAPGPLWRLPGGLVPLVGWPMPSSSQFPSPGRIREALFACSIPLKRCEELSNDLSRDYILWRTEGCFSGGGVGECGEMRALTLSENNEVLPTSSTFL